MPHPKPPPGGYPPPFLPFTAAPRAAAAAAGVSGGRGGWHPHALPQPPPPYLAPPAAPARILVRHAHPPHASWHLLPPGAVTIADVAASVGTALFPSRPAAAAGGVVALSLAGAALPPAAPAVLLRDGDEVTAVREGGGRRGERASAGVRPWRRHRRRWERHRRHLLRLSLCHALP